MKSFFKITMLFLTLVFSLILELSALPSQDLSLQEFIAPTPKETVVLVSNSIGQGEIRTTQEDSEYNWGSLPPTVITYIQPETFFFKNNSLLKRGFIHNLSTDNQKVHQIRAP